MRSAQVLITIFKGSGFVFPSVVTSKPAIEGHFKTGQRAAART
jgi:hypothetical protein